MSDEKKKRVQFIKGIDYNWFSTNESGDSWESLTVGVAGVKRIIDVSEHNSVAYRVEFNDGTAQIIFNPNRVIYGVQP